MFHVKQTSLRRYVIAFATILLSFSCGTIRTYQIADYQLFPQGRTIGSTELNAFIFENNQKNLPFLYFLANRFNQGNIYDRVFDIKIEGTKCLMMVYDDAEFDKYFKLSNFSMINEVPENGRVGDNQRFIAISVVGPNNEDFLASTSLFQKVTVDYLSALKKEYYKP